MRPEAGERRTSHLLHWDLPFKEETWGQENRDHSYPFLKAKKKWEKKTASDKWRLTHKFSLNSGIRNPIKFLELYVIVTHFNDKSIFCLMSETSEVVV